MNRLLYWYAGTRPCRLINDGERPYLERYYLFTAFGVRFYLHRFVDSDPDRGLHDHPWRWAKSLLLYGWYREERRDGRHEVLWWNWLVGDSFHRVILPTGLASFVPVNNGQLTLQPLHVWTLFFHSVGDVKPWGFLKPMIIAGAVTPYSMFTPHDYKREGVQKGWWTHLPIGRLSDRQPIQKRV